MRNSPPNTPRAAVRCSGRTGHHGRPEHEATEILTPGRSNICTRGYLSDVLDEGCCGLAGEQHSGTGSGLLNTFNEAGAGMGIAIVAPIAAYIATHQQAIGTSRPVADAHGIGAAWIALSLCALVAGIIATAIVRASAPGAGREA